MTGSTLAPEDLGTAATGTLDEARVEAFAGRLFELYTGGMLTFMVDIGHRTGLFAAAAAGPATSAELAGRADLQERYVREWLGAMVTGGIVDHDPATGTYRLPPEHAACLTGTGSSNLAAFSRLATHLAKHVDAVALAFREGGGVPYAAFRPEFTDVMDALGRGTFDELLVDAYLPLVPGLEARLAAGARVADVGCGTGRAMVLLAAAYPASTFVGYDLADDAVARARSEAAAAGLANARFEVRDAAGLTVEQPLDVVFVFDAIHDQVDPAAVLRADPRRPGARRDLRHGRAPGLQRPGRQPRQPAGADALLGEHAALPDRVAGRRRGRPGRGLGRAAGPLHARRRRLRRRGRPRGAGRPAQRRVRGLQARGLTAPGPTAQAGAAGPADLASTWIPTWRLSRPRMAEMPRRRRGEITRSRPRAV